ncbi:MAG: hypothetical protein M2R45_02808 [Verrucomicrobia subdivision 3 bacterium]|nr:hypothetical protein [Limisphaerales bacterium]MCS1414360.1 hypothetical protein [Limisphaerales bacterium]
MTIEEETKVLYWIESQANHTMEHLYNIMQGICEEVRRTLSAMLSPLALYSAIC